LRESSSCDSCPILICSFWFSSCSCMALCWVSRILLRALSRLFLTATLFLSRRRRYSALSLLMLLLFTGARRVGRRKEEKSWRSETQVCVRLWGSRMQSGVLLFSHSFIYNLHMKTSILHTHTPACWRGCGGGLCSRRSSCCRDWKTCTAGKTVPSCHHCPLSPVPETGRMASCPSEPAGYLVWCGSGCGSPPSKSWPTPG